MRRDPTATECVAAFDAMIMLARQMAPGSADFPPPEYAWAIARIGLAAGFEPDETAEYAWTIWHAARREAENVAKH